MSTRTRLWIAAVLSLAAREAPAQQHAFARCDHFQAQALANEVERLRESLSLGADIECRQDLFDGATALMQAAGGGAGDAVRLLLQRGAKVNARDKSGWTALRHARHRYDAFVKAGITPLRFELVMEVLKQAGATE
jgi:ankyrin repeat protein